MTNTFCHRNFRGTCSSVEMLKGYMLICRNAEGVQGQRKVGNPCFRATVHNLPPSKKIKFAAVHM